MVQQNLSTVKFWIPSGATEAAATLVCTLQANDIGGKFRQGRNQTTVISRSGTTYVYDRGRNLNEIISLSFSNIVDSERSAFITFLEQCQWGSTKFRFRDVTGTERIVRIVNNAITYTENGPQARTPADGSAPRFLWDFSFELVDLTNNFDEVNTLDSPVANALALHIADYDEPHNPIASISLSIADGTKTVEQFLVEDYSTVAWMVEIEKNGNRAEVDVVASHNGYVGIDATGTPDYSISPHTDTGTVSAEVTLTVDLTGTGGAQYMRLRAATTVDGYTINVRRIKF
ncbi:MAG: hypothetical protein H0X04_00170 [Chthoniobacterales bacterium]|nr:hypothetical protein [Chthoniobacterales bacterium]